MRLLSLFLFTLCLQLPTVKGLSDEYKTNLTKEEIERLSICMANLLWDNLNSCCCYYDFDLILKTMKELSMKQTAPMDLEECTQIMEEAWNRFIEEEACRNLETANQFLQALSAKPNVAELQSQKLFYEILRTGTGSPVSETASPLLHFKESDLTGTIIRDTYTKSPVRLTLSETILGFAKGVSGMRVGEKRKLYVHPDLGYGKFEGPKPQQLLIFEVEILEN